MKRRFVALLGAAATAGGLLTGCGSDGPGGAGDGAPELVASFYPLQFVTQRIAGDRAEVRSLTPPGAEPHDLELAPKDIAAVGEADLVVYLRNFQPSVDEAVSDEAADAGLDVAPAARLDLTATDEHEGEEAAAAGDVEPEGPGRDPHFWLDPTRLATVAEQTAVKLGEADPAHKADFTARAAALSTELKTLDGEFTSGLKTCERHELVTSHTAFHYLADRYGLTQIGITGIDPESEPSPQRLAAVAEEAKEHGATTIFFETLVSPKVAETLAREVGAQTAVLDPLEGLTDENADYFSVMRANLTALTTALGCDS